ncbi:hypothetical protein ALC62_08205 [Cyphomyrmex costatus]|uniref:Uncharacterized protein n=1 Tax=Cyphomyrmex costatus TaxID=456900 RepID=A0A195CLM9_9HYME|nr:hypothetical protein ALC62_08205 [Cyphomyrmex costatus]
MRAYICAPARFLHVVVPRRRGMEERGCVGKRGRRSRRKERVIEKREGERGGNGQARLKTRRQLLRGIMRNPVNAPVSGHHSTASLTLGSIGMQ